MQSTAVRSQPVLGATPARPAGVQPVPPKPSATAARRTARVPKGLGLSAHTALTHGRGLVVANVAVTQQRVASSSDDAPPPGTSFWEATLYTDDLEDDAAGRMAELASNLSIKLVDEDGHVQDQGSFLDGWEQNNWESQDKKVIGSSFVGKIPVPNRFTKPAVLLLQLEDSDKPFYVSRVVLKDSKGPDVTFPVNSWIDSSQGARVFFDGKARLPANTPLALQQYRQTELAALRGTAADATTERKGADRIYDYSMYNDLGKPTAASGLQGLLFSVLSILTRGKLRLGDAQPRPTLGGPTYK